MNCYRCIVISRAWISAQNRAKMLFFNERRPYIAPFAIDSALINFRAISLT